MEELVKIISTATGLDLKKRTRRREYVIYRSLFYHITKKTNQNTSLEKIGKAVNVDHATVIHGLANYEMYKNYYPELQEVENIVLGFQKATLVDVKEHFTELDLANQKIKLLREEVEKLKTIKEISNTIAKKTIGERIDELIENSENYQLIIERLEAFLKMNK